MTGTLLCEWLKLNIHSAFLVFLKKVLVFKRYRYCSVFMFTAMLHVSRFFLRLCFLSHGIL